VEGPRENWSDTLKRRFADYRVNDVAAFVGRVSTRSSIGRDPHRFHLYPKLVAADDGMFKHHGEYVPCNGCQLDPFTGETQWYHGHIVVDETNGGVRCEPHGAIGSCSRSVPALP
jgi:hypothetical protein